MTSKIHLTFENDLAILTMDSGENRINPDFVNSMNDVLDRVESNSEAKVVLTTGRGKFYSNGLDLAWGAENIDELPKLVLSLNKLLWRFMTFPLPTIACLNGHTYAGGAFLALCHDVIYMNQDKGWLCMNEIFLRLRPGEFFIKCLKARISDAHLQSRLLVFGERFTAEEAFKSGLIQGKHPAENLMAEAKKLGRNLSAMNYDRNMFRTMKEDLLSEVKEYMNTAGKLGLGAKL